MINYQFEELEIGSTFLTGSVEITASAAHEKSKPSWEMNEEDVFKIHWETLVFTQIHSEYIPENSKRDHNLIHFCAMSSALGYGFDKFKERISKKAFEYIEYNHLWED